MMVTLRPPRRLTPPASRHNVNSIVLLVALFHKQIAPGLTHGAVNG